MKPNDKMVVEVFADADFAGVWPYEYRNDPTCVKSRAGYAITVTTCPVVWNSWLMSDIALSTMESEYNALSLCLRSVLPFRRILMKVMTGLNLDEKSKIVFQTSV